MIKSVGEGEVEDRPQGELGINELGNITYCGCSLVFAVLNRRLWSLEDYCIGGALRSASGARPFHLGSSITDSFKVASGGRKTENGVKEDGGGGRSSGGVHTTDTNCNPPRCERNGLWAGFELFTFQQADTTLFIPRQRKWSWYS